MAPLQDAQFLVRAVKLVHVADAAHAELRPVAFRQLSQRGIETARAEEESRVQHLSVAQLAAHALFGDARARCAVAEIRVDPGAAGGAHAAVGELDITPENTEALQLREFRSGEHGPHSRGGKPFEHAAHRCAR